MGKLYNYVVYIYSSVNRMTWFVECAGRIISLNKYMRWNSWFNILNVALEDNTKATL